jgi:hypothetical protein
MYDKHTLACQYGNEPGTGSITLRTSSQKLVLLDPPWKCVTAGVKSPWESCTCVITCVIGGPEHFGLTSPAPSLVMQAAVVRMMDSARLFNDLAERHARTLPP